MEDQIFAMMKIDSFNIPDSVTTIKNRVFYSTFTLTSITIPRNVTQINSEAFVGSSITDAIVNIDKLGTSNFPTNTGDDQTFVGKTGVTITGYKIFKGQGTLSNATSDLSGASIVYIEDYDSIESNAFQGAISMTEITIPESVVSIGSNAFQIGTTY